MNKFISIYILENYKELGISEKKYIPSFYNSYRYDTKVSYYILNNIYCKYVKKEMKKDDIILDINGKPIFKDKNLFFNISHSKDFLAVGLANTNIGIDIEQNRKIKENAIKKIYSPKDTENDKIKVWNIKEAYSKYLGIGLKLDFSKISIQEININCNLYKCNTIMNNNENMYFSLCYNKENSSIIPNIHIAKVIARKNIC